VTVPERERGVAYGRFSMLPLLFPVLASIGLQRFQPRGLLTHFNFATPNNLLAFATRIFTDSPPPVEQFSWSRRLSF